VTGDHVAFGALLKRYRTASGLTQEALAERACLSARAISDLERGVNRAPRHDTLKLLAAALGLTEHQAALFGAAARPEGRPPSPSVRSLSSIPIPPTALIGREEEMGQALTFIARDRVRLLTLTGPSGVGKTRLAIELAADLADRFADGVAFVELSPVRDASLLPSVMAQTLGLQETGAEPIGEQVRACLRDQELLLVLDNFEQIREAAPFVAGLLAGCRNLRALVTSRAPLHVRGEQELAIPPLALPEAVRLFEARARSLRPDWIAVEPQVEEICQRLDCLPLAIELAAMHVKVLALPVLLERLSSRLPLLGGGALDLPERQRTMRGAIAWSYELLTPGQQRCFRVLGVFIGGWTLEAAEAVCPDGGVLVRDEVLLATASLVDLSLVVSQDRRVGIARFAMLETVREFALEQLRAASEEGDARRRHALHYAEHLEAVLATSLVPSAGQDEVAEMPNCRAALEWAAESGETVLGLWLAVGAGSILFVSGQISDSQAWIERMLAEDARAGCPAPSSLRSAALYGASRGAMARGDAERAAVLAGEALDMSRRLGDGMAASRAAAVLGSLAQGRGDARLAESYFEQARAEALDSGNPIAIGLALLNLGEHARLRGDLGRARALHEESLERSRAAGSTWATACVLTLLGHVARDQGDHPLARSRYGESLLLFRDLGNRTYQAACLEGCAALALAEGDAERAAALCAFAAGLRGQAGTPLPANEQQAFDTTLSSARRELGEEAFSGAWSRSESFSDEEGMAFALAYLGQPCPAE
jgi:predicted ATPase/DNA-binding XRE family transcriptional regulator